MTDSAFWARLDELVASAKIVIDRSQGSAHPRYPQIIYPYNYGYLENTTAGDGGGIDVWIGSLPEKTVTALVCTIDLHKRDVEIKLLLGCTPQEARDILTFHNSGSMAALLLER